LYPDAVGGWSVGASWAGDAIYDEVVSTFGAITLTESSLQISPLIIGIPLIVLIIVIAFFVMRRR
jgi:hypothetical protein